MRAGTVVAERAGLGVIGHATDRFRGEALVRRVAHVAGEQTLEMRDASRVREGQAGAPQQQIGVEHREPFAEPQARDRRLRAVIDVAVLDRPDRHQVPGVHELVRCFLKERMGIARQVGALRAQRDRVAMLEAATEGPVLEQERVLSIGRPPEERESLVNEPLNAGYPRTRVERCRVGQRPVHDAMQHATLDKAPFAQLTDEHG